MRRNGRSYMELLELSKDPRYCIVESEERYIHKGSTGRLVTRETMLKAREKCESKNECVECVKQQEIFCIEAWRLTRGKGIKMW